MDNTITITLNHHMVPSSIQEMASDIYKKLEQEQLNLKDLRTLLLLIMNPREPITAQDLQIQRMMFRLGQKKGYHERKSTQDKKPPKKK